MALQLGLPDLADDGDVERLLKADRLLRFNPNHDERGRFASAPGGGAANGAAQAPSAPVLGDGGAANHYVSPGGARFRTALRLSAAQSATAGKIIDYGEAHGYRPDQIAVAVGDAFYESSLGTLEHNPTHPHMVGLFQYKADTWSFLGHESLDRFNDDHQIIAIFKDIDRF
jgi:hypothetical protein